MCPPLHEEDQIAWTIEDEFYSGSAFLVAPILSASAVRSIYLPPGEWIDLWSAERVRGPIMLNRVGQPLERMPLFVPGSSQVPFSPEPVACTDKMDLSRIAEIVFDQTYSGFRSSPFGAHIDL